MRIVWVIVLLIAYGSLYPGNFSAPAENALEQFLADWRLFTSWGDLLGNIALFFPLGMAGIIFARKKTDLGVHIAVLFFLAFAYSFALQLAQVWLPSRSAALADMFWNMAGMTAGMAMASLMMKQRLRGTVQRFGLASLVPLSILTLWLLTELLPLVPSLDMQKFKDALKPLFLEFHFSLPAAIIHSAGTFAAGSAFLALGRPPALWLGAALALILAGKLVIVNLTLNASIMTGMLAGYLGCLFVLRVSNSKLIFELAFWLLLLAWTISAITPFSPASGGTFNGIPFANMLAGSMEANVRGLVQSLFTYTALLWLMQKSGIGVKGAAAGLAIWSSLLELIQMGLLGRNADVTEPMLILLIGWVLLAAQDHEPKERTEAAAPNPQPVAASSAEATVKHALGSIAIGVGICTAVGWLVTQSSLTPYNVRELVYEGHPLRSLVLLAMLVYWAIGFPILVAQWLSRGELYLLSFPPLVSVHGLIAWLLLWSAVPSESIHDIVGAPVLAWPWEWELLGRFLALFSSWSVAATAGTLIAAWRILPDARSALLGWAIGAFLIMPVSYYIVILEASTDNLVELIAGNGSIGSFLMIGLAVVIITFAGTKAALASTPGPSRRITAAAWVLGSGLVAYLALNLGLEQIIVKYGQVFSAKQFLLSSERSQLAGSTELLVRYTALYIVFIAAIVMVQHPLWRWALLTKSPRSVRSTGGPLPVSATHD